MNGDENAKISWQSDASDIATVYCSSGAWTVRGIQQLERTLDALAWPTAQQLVLDAGAITTLDTSGAWLLHRTVQMLQQGGRSYKSSQGLQPGFNSLLHLVMARAVKGYEAAPRKGMLERLGREAWKWLQDLVGMFAFVGEFRSCSFMRCFTRHACAGGPILYNLQTAGFEVRPLPACYRS